MAGNESANDYRHAYAFDLVDAGNDGSVEETSNSTYDQPERQTAGGSSVKTHGTSYVYDDNGSMSSHAQVGERRFTARTSGTG